VSPLIAIVYDDDDDDELMMMIIILFTCDKNELKAGLVLHMRQLKEDNEKNWNITLSGTESVKAVRLKSSGHIAI